MVVVHAQWTDGRGPVLGSSRYPLVVWGLGLPRCCLQGQAAGVPGLPQGDLAGWDSTLAATVVVDFSGPSGIIRVVIAGMTAVRAVSSRILPCVLWDIISGTGWKSRRHFCSPDPF